MCGSVEVTTLLLVCLRCVSFGVLSFVYSFLGVVVCMLVCSPVVSVFVFLDYLYIRSVKSCVLTFFGFVNPCEQVLAGAHSHFGTVC